MDQNVDFLAASTWDETIYERMRWLREHDPVHWSPATGPRGLWVLSKFADVAYVSKHNKLFCSGQGVRPGNPTKLSLIDEDPPRHTRLRGLINKGFTPRMVQKLEGDFRRIVTETIDEVVGRGACDFVTDVAVPLPILLIADMIGIEKRDRERFHRWSDALIHADGNLHDPEIMNAASHAFMEYSAYLHDIIEDRRLRPREDLVSVLVGAKDDGVLQSSDRELPMALSEEHQRLANDELIMILVLLMVAGNETTRNAISGGMHLLLQHPGERRKLLDDPAKIPAACEEIVRLVSPVRSFGRTATEDTELRGRKIAQGDTVLLLYPSANRDAERFADPDAFRVERNPEHLGFGIGQHFCLGANLARMELRVAFTELLRRLPDMELACERPEIKPSPLVHSYMHMPVRFSPERRAAVS